MVKQLQIRPSEYNLKPDKIEWFRQLWESCCAVDSLGHGEIGAAVADAAGKLGVTPANFYIYLQRFRQNPLFEALSPRLTKKRRTRKKRIEGRQKELLDEVIETLYLTRERRRPRKCYKKYVRMCIAEGVEPASDNAMRRAIALLPAGLVARRRDEPHERNTKFRINHDVPQMAFAPMDIVQIDHRCMDVQCVDEESRLPCGRAWLTLVTDHFTRAVLGFYLTFDAPSSVSVARALLHAASPKEKWLADLKLPGKWPMFGVPGLVYTDNGSDFTSDAIRDGYRRQGINPPMFRPGGQPNYGGIIERAVATVGEPFIGEAGDTDSSSHKRGDKNPEKSAALTIDDMERIITNFIVNIYHPERYSKDASPLFKWLNSEKEGLFHVSSLTEDELRTFYIDFLPTEERDIQQYGVRIKNHIYRHDILNTFIYRRDVNHLFHYDPKDVRSIYFKNPDDGQYYELQSTISDMPAMSSKTYNAKLKVLRAESDLYKDPAQIREAEDLNEKIIEDAKSRTRSKRARTAAEQAKRTGRPEIMDRPAIVQIEREEIPDDDADFIHDEEEMIYAYSSAKLA